MPENESFDADEIELMQSLGSLLPVSPEVSEQGLWYQAGLHAGLRRARLWGGVAAAVVVLAAGMFAVRPGVPTVYVDRVVVQGVGSSVEPGTGSTSAPERPVASLDYLRFRDAVAQRGMDALPQAEGSGVLSQPTQRAWTPRNSAAAPSPWDSLNTRG